MPAQPVWEWKDFAPSVRGLVRVVAYCCSNPLGGFGLPSRCTRVQRLGCGSCLARRTIDLASVRASTQRRFAHRSIYLKYPMDIGCGKGRDSARRRPI